MTLHIFTCSTDPNRLLYLKESGNLHNIEVKCLMPSEWIGFYYTKIKVMQEAIESLNDDDLVVFTDAYDVIINGEVDEIFEKFKTYNCDILLSAELYCWPPYYKAELDIEVKSNTKYKYANSGGYMGYVKNLKQLFAWKTEEEKINMCKDHGDQAYFMRYFTDNHKTSNIKLDTNATIFQSMVFVSWKEIDFRNGRMFNNVLNSYPNFIHFNGSSMYTNQRHNIMPVFIDKKKLSKENPNVIYNVDEYTQLREDPLPQI